MVKKERYSNFRKYQIYYVFGLAFLVLAFPACKLSTSNFNNKSDIAAAKQIAADFYKELSTRHYKETYPYFTKIFFSKVDTSSLNSLYKNYENKLGTINKVSLLKCETKRTKSDKQICIYVAVFKVTRSKGITKERFLLQSEGDKNPEIFRYDIFEAPVGKGQQETRL